MNGTEDALACEKQHKNQPKYPSFEHVGGLLDKNMSSFFDFGDFTLPSNIIDFKEDRDVWEDMEDFILLDNVNKYKSKGITEKSQLVDWWNIVSILREREKKRNGLRSDGLQSELVADPIISKTAPLWQRRFAEMSTLICHLEESVKNEEIALKQMKQQILIQQKIITDTIKQEKKETKKNQEKKETKKNQEKNQDKNQDKNQAENQAIEGSVLSTERKEEDPSNATNRSFINLQHERNKTISRSTDLTKMIEIDMELHEEEEGNNRWLLKEVSKARTLIYIGYSDFTDKYDGRSCSQLGIYLILRYGPKLAATVIGK